MNDVNTSSRPSDLRITDMRVARLVDCPMRSNLIRLDTNQDIYGLGEVRDGASAIYALMLKRQLLGENPCDVDRLFRKIKQFGGHARQGGGVCAVEMALMDLLAKHTAFPPISWQAEGSAIECASTVTPIRHPTQNRWANACRAGSRWASPFSRLTSACAY